jgi:anti-anti-sigma factor
MLLYHIDKEEDINIIKFNGDLIAGTVTSIKDEIQQIYQSEEKPKIIFDLSDVNFMDSSGIGFLVSILKDLNKKDSKLKLANLNTTLTNTLKQVQLFSFFEVYESLDEAIESFY